MALQQPELKQLRTGNEERFLNAIKCPKIANCNLEDLKQSLRYVMVKIGLRSANWPTDEEKQILIAHILDEFKNHTVDEIKLAFDLAITNKLDIEDVNCYENFSCLYFSKIMGSYRTWAGQVYTQLKEQEEMKRVLEISQPKELTELEWQQFYNNIRDNVKAKVYGIELIPDLLYDWMERNGKINLTLEEKKKYFNNAIELKQIKLNELYLNNRSNIYKIGLDQFKINIMEGVFPKATNNELKSIAKKMVLFDLMNEENGKLSQDRKQVE